MREDLLLENIKNLADSSGLDVLGFADASEFSNYALSRSKRRDPKLTLPNARTIIVAGIYIGGLVLPKWSDPWYGRTSRLYLSEFFCDVVKPLKPIIDLLQREGHQAIVCEDGSALPLKLAAVRAGLGWQGKQSLLITKKYGSFLALGGIITDADLEHNTEEEPNRCRTCDKCQQACPLNAIEQPYILDRKRCISSLLQGDEIPEKTHDVMENRIFDCEICQQVCPWNQKHINDPLPTKMTEEFREKVEELETFYHLPALAELSERDYEIKLGHLNTGLPYRMFRRNVMRAINKASGIDSDSSKEI